MSVDCTQRFRSIRCTFGHIMVGTPRPHSTHVHEQVSMTFCVSGTTAKAKSDGGVIEMAQGSVTVFDSYEPHATLNRDENAEVLTMLLDQHWVEKIISNCSEKDEDYASDHAAKEQQLRLQFDEIVRAMIADDDDLLKNIEHLVAGVVAATFQLLGRPRPEGTQAIPGILDYRIRKALRYIDDTIADRMQLGEIAKHVGLSRSHFFEQFRRSVGVSPSTYANWHRMLIAAEQLANDSPTLAELSDLLGFSGPPQFSRFFVQQLGVSPSQFRSNVRSFDRPNEPPKTKPTTARLAR